MSSLFWNYVDPWSEVFCPRLSLYLLWGVLFSFPVFVMAFVFQCMYLAIALYRRWKLKRILTLVVLLFLFPILWQVKAIIDTRINRWDIFPIGGWSKVLWVGGPRKLRTEALCIMNTAPLLITDTSSHCTSYWSPPKSDWPTSVRALRPSHVTVDRKAQIVDVSIPRRDHFSDQFGFLIKKVDTPAPKIFDNHRIWKITDGIYFYQKW
jgi:hypothetical protein